MVAVLFISGVIGTVVGCGGAKENAVNESVKVKMVVASGYCGYNPAIQCSLAFWSSQPNREVALENNWAYLFCGDTDEGYNVGIITDEDFHNQELINSLNAQFGGRNGECLCTLQLDESAWEQIQTYSSLYCYIEFDSFIEFDPEEVNK